MLFLFALSILFYSSLGSSLNENEAMMALEMSSFAYQNFGKGKKSSFNQLSEACVEEVLRITCHEDEEDIELPENLKNVCRSSKSPCELVKYTSPGSNASWGIVGVELNGKPQIYVTFRGTISVNEVLIDLNFKAVENDDLGVYVHAGMNNMFTEYKMHEFVLMTLYGQWKKMTAKFDSEVQLIVTGHSLGGGLAQIFAAYISGGIDFKFLSNEEYYFAFMKFLQNGRTYTFGSPQVFRLYEKTKFGTEEGLSAGHIKALFCSEGESLIPPWIEKVENSSFHFVNEKDMVPLLNLLRERPIVNIAEASKSKITENSPGSGMWQSLKAKEWKKFICGFGSALWTVSCDVSSCVLNELCFDSSYKQWGTILYYTERAQFYVQIDLKELKNIAGSIKDVKANWELWKHFDAMYRKNFLKSARTLHKLEFGSPLHKPNLGLIDIETISELRKLHSERHKTVAQLKEKKNEWRNLNQNLEAARMKVEDLSCCLDEDVAITFSENEHIRFEENTKKINSEDILDNSFPPYIKTKLDQYAFDSSIERFQRAENSLDMKQKDLVKELKTATDASKVRLEEQRQNVKKILLSKNEKEKEYNNLEIKLGQIIERIDKIENESANYLKAIKE